MIGNILLRNIEILKKKHSFVPFQEVKIKLIIFLYLGIKYSIIK